MAPPEKAARKFFKNRNKNLHNPLNDIEAEGGDDVPGQN